MNHVTEYYIKPGTQNINTCNPKRFLFEQQVLHRIRIFDSSVHSEHTACLDLTDKSKQKTYNANI